MDQRRLKKLLRDVQGGALGLEDALKTLRDLPFEDLAFARIDHHRTLRQGIPEVVFAAGKTPEQVADIAGTLLKRSGRAFVTKTEADHVTALESLGRGVRTVHNPRAGTVALYGPGAGGKKPAGRVLILTAGTADLPVAEEAQETLRFLGSRCKLVADVGVAGIHRLTDIRDDLAAARVVVVTAGMEGALPSVVGGLFNGPVVGVPTSAGYGTSFGGLTPLMAMLNSCVPGLAVVNIDNGFGAACLAHRINRPIRTR